jgi:hypothetical protein
MKRRWPEATLRHSVTTAQRDFGDGSGYVDELVHAQRKIHTLAQLGHMGPHPLQQDITRGKKATMCMLRSQDPYTGSLSTV